MQPVRKTSRFIWLTSKLAQKKARIGGLIARLSALEFPGRMKPALAEKFQHLLHQIEAEQEKEFDIICEIQSVEEKHREQRLQKKLSKADLAFTLSPEGRAPETALAFQPAAETGRQGFLKKTESYGKFLAPHDF